MRSEPDLASDAEMSLDLGADMGREDLGQPQDMSDDTGDQGAPDQDMSEEEMAQDLGEDQAADMEPEVVCPVAVARLQAAPEQDAAAPFTVRPLETIALSAPGDAGFTYAWSVVSKPRDSNARLLPSARVAAPTLWLDLTGQYEVELEVTDPAGATRCPTTKVQIIAVPEQHIYVELTWDSPADPDQTDVFGTDMDLHYLHSNATAWDRAPWAVYWNNREGDWGVLGNPDDNAVMLEADNDGAGPEVVGQGGPEANKPYAVGVHYYNDAGYGASYATVRVYMLGVLAWEARDVYMAGSGSFWDAARITAAPEQVTGGMTVTQGFPPLMP